MNTKSKKIRRIPIMLGLLMMLAVVLASCVNVDNIEEIIDQSLDALENESVIVEESKEEISTPDGYTEAPVVKSVVNITPDTIAVAGTCEEGSVISIKGAVEDVSTTAIGNYFIIEAQLPYQNNLLEITATVEGKEESLANSFVASYNATADTRLDGNSVSIGVGSRLYFDKMVEDSSGKNLYTESELNSILDYVNNTVNDYYMNRAGAHDAELIFMLVPNVTTIYPEVYPEGVVEPTNTTLYDQILKTLNKTRATVVDMREIYMNLRDDATVNETYGGLYRVTDSSLTDYGAYLAYNELMNVVAKRFPDAAPRALEEFEWKTVSTVGGNLPFYRELDNTVVSEDIVISVPKFSLALGTDGNGTTSLKSLRKYNDMVNGDYSYFTDTDNADGKNGIAERWLIDTKRSEELDLPNALIIRDYASLSFTDILAERFEKCLVSKNGELGINLSLSGQYAAEGKTAVDYIIVIVSEENLENAFTSAFAN